MSDRSLSVSCWFNTDERYTDESLFRSDPPTRREMLEILSGMRRNKEQFRHQTGGLKGGDSASYSTEECLFKAETGKNRPQDQPKQVSQQGWLEPVHPKPDQAESRPPPGVAPRSVPWIHPDRLRMMGVISDAPQSAPLQGGNTDRPHISAEGNTGWATRNPSAPANHNSGYHDVESHRSEQRGITPQGMRHESVGSPSGRMSWSDRGAAPHRSWESGGSEANAPANHSSRLWNAPEEKGIKTSERFESERRGVRVPSSDHRHGSTGGPEQDYNLNRVSHHPTSLGQADSAGQHRRHPSSACGRPVWGEFKSSRYQSS